jgi:hypothetical protein
VAAGALPGLAYMAASGVPVRAGATSRVISDCHPGSEGASKKEPVADSANRYPGSVVLSRYHSWLYSPFLASGSAPPLRRVGVSGTAPLEKIGIPH